MNRQVSQARASPAADQASRPQTPMAGSRTAATPTSGQCQRYHAYDRRPSHRNGDQASAWLTALPGARSPPTTSSAVPNAGRTAAMPG